MGGNPRPYVGKLGTLYGTFAKNVGPSRLGNVRSPIYDDLTLRQNVGPLT